jgi:hypothetical protein
MDSALKQALADAVNALIHDGDASLLFKQFNATLSVVRKGAPVRLVGRASVLNPLLDLTVLDSAAAERVFDLVERKRATAGHAPLNDTVERRKRYMRELMAERRARLRRVVDISNSMRSDRDAIKGRQRMQFEGHHVKRWGAILTQREQEAREAAGGRIPLHEFVELREQLWRDVDAELDAFEAFARAESRLPLSQRKPNGFDKWLTR